jgi:hypothetical protein
VIITKHPVAIGWKHDYVSGISTREGVLTAWPASLGAWPTQEQVEQWEAEWLARPPEPSFQDDLVTAVTGTDEEKATAKNRLVAGKY